MRTRRRVPSAPRRRGHVVCARPRSGSKRHAPNWPRSKRRRPSAPSAARKRSPSKKRHGRRSPIRRRGACGARMARDRRNDSGLVRPMFEASERGLGRPIKRVLADTGFAQIDDIAALSSRSETPVGVYIHPAKDRADVKPATLLVRQKQREREPQTIKDWRQRMATNEAEEIMKKRGRIERVNANFKNRGFGTLLVRGLTKVQAIALWHALAHNLSTALRLRAMAASAA